MTPPSLDALRDIHLPASIPEAWLVMGFLAIVSGVFWYLRRHWRRRPLRSALHALEAIATIYARDGDATRLAQEVSQLVRHYAMIRFPKAGIEGLAGADWLGFLDAHGGNGEFTHGAGSPLESRPYQRQGELDAAALLALVRRWMEANPQ